MRVALLGISSAARRKHTVSAEAECAPCLNASLTCVQRCGVQHIVRSICSALRCPWHCTLCVLQERNDIQKLLGHRRWVTLCHFMYTADLVQLQTLMPLLLCSGVLWRLEVLRSRCDRLRSLLQLRDVLLYSTSHG